MQQHGHAGDDVNLNERHVDTISPILFFLQEIIYNNIFNA